MGHGCIESVRLLSLPPEPACACELDARPAFETLFRRFHDARLQTALFMAEPEMPEDRRLVAAREFVEITQDTGDEMRRLFAEFQPNDARVLRPH